MKLSALHPADDLLDDPQALAVRYEQDGCLLLRGALGRASHDVPALDDLVSLIDQGRDPLRAVAERICGHPMRIWRALHIFAAVPDDPAYVTAPHQDNFAVTSTGDYRRMWIALTGIPFADGGLGLALARVSKDLEASLWFPQVQQFSIFVLVYYPRQRVGVYRSRSKTW